MTAFESGRRLCLLFEAGRARYSVEATAIAEVAPPAGSSDKIRGVHELRDLSELLGGDAEERPGMGLVLDVSPTLAVRVKRVVEVADVARDPFFLVPPGLGPGYQVLVRGAILHGERLYLELTSEALPHERGSPLFTVARPVYITEEPPDRALLFESQGRLFGIPLTFVSQVIPATAAFCPLPAPGGPVAGLHPHAQVLWPIYSAPGLMGGAPKQEELFILTELAGQNVGLCASRVLGVHEKFVSTDERGEFRTAKVETPALFLDLQRMFS